MNSSERRRKSREDERLFGAEADRLICLAALQGRSLRDVYLQASGRKWGFDSGIYTRSDIINALKTNARFKDIQIRHAAEVIKAVQAPGAKPGARCYNPLRF